jgi:hypothetical protein
MNCAWLEKWIEFNYNNQLIRLQGIVHSEPCELLEGSAEQVLKWDKGNELWATVLIEPSTKSSPLLDSYIHNGIPDQIKDLILIYGSIFEETKDLPPSRQYDHSISLLHNAAPNKLYAL